MIMGQSPCLESNNPRPTELVKVGSQFSGRNCIEVNIIAYDIPLQRYLTSQSYIIIMVELIHSFNFSSNIKLLNLIEQVLD